MATKTKKQKDKLSAANKKFWALPAAAKRVAIAKDVIKQINLCFLKPEKGTYFRINPRHDINKIPNQLDKLFGIMRKQNGSCDVCGIGGLFAGLVNLGDKVETDEVDIVCEIDRYDVLDIDDDIMRKKLRNVFSSNQLGLIECAFEMSTGFDDVGKGNLLYSDRAKAMKFGQRFMYSDTRLIGIMENIIKNKGTFKP